MIMYYFRNITFIILFFVSSICAESPDFLHMVEDPWPPFTYGEEFATEGIAVDITDVIFSELGIDYEIRLFPWKRCLQRVKLGVSDGVILSGISKEREEYMWFSTPIMYDRDLIWYREGFDFQWETLEDLKRYKIAYTLGFSYGEEFTEASRKYNFDIYTTTNDLMAFKLLESGRVDIFICNETVAKTIFKDNPEFNGIITSAENPFKEVSLHMAFSKVNIDEGFVDRVNEVILKLQSSGVISNTIFGKN